MTQLPTYWQEFQCFTKDGHRQQCSDHCKQRAACCKLFVTRPFTRIKQASDGETFDKIVFALYSFTLQCCDLFGKLWGIKAIKQLSSFPTPFLWPLGSE